MKGQIAILVQYLKGGGSIGLDPESQSITVAVHFGGEHRNLPVANCIGGKVMKFDYMSALHMNKNNLDLFAEKCGISGEGFRYYIIKNGGFKLLLNDEDILEQVLEQLEKREFTVYIEFDPPKPQEVAVESDRVGKNATEKRRIKWDDELYENFVDDVSAEMDSADETNSESSGDVVKEFKKAVQSYAIKQKRSVKFTKNDSFRVYAVCSGDGCKWKIHANKLKNEETFQINLYQDEHTCPQVFNVRNVKTSSLSERYLQDFKSDLKDVKGWRVDIMNQLRCHISRDQAYRAKRQALKKLEGSPEQQFTKLWDYAEELRRTNPGSTIILGVNDVNRGLAYKNALWKATRASTGGEFKLRMEEMKHLNQDTFDWFNDKPPTEWSKSHLKFPKCDILLTIVVRALMETSWMQGKPILTMLEWIREYLMRRLQENREKSSKKWKDTLCPKIKKLLQKNVDKIDDCIPIKANDRHYQISCYDGNQYSVDLEMRTCTCRIWQLSGIPCKHACIAIFNQNLQPEDMVHPYYNVDTYKQVGPGRPAGARNREPDEPNVKTTKKSCKKPIKLKRQKVKHHCKICGEEGHNAKGCALWKDMQEPGLDQEVMDSLFSDHPTQEQRGASSSNNPRKRKHSVYQDPTRMNMTAAASGVSDQPHILPPIVEDNEPTEIEFTPEILTEAGPSQTQASVQGPTMFEQLQMAHTSMPVQPQMTLQPRLNIRAHPPMTGIGVMPCFSSRPLIPVSKTIIKEHGKKFVDLSKWPSQSAKDHQQK
ncbi:hypothetical protein Sango_2108600 [Sesamum angolense]|uniref:SWIM-type domain-containing protein n=1 Tax=Sesamum angolense TaxID=2727404 RepID=A0AAE2BM60_9LAMI|nr:hypothetical protein Sango_2108600 [Sesamum angolense]